MRTCLVVAVLITLLTLGCSTGGNAPLTPDVQAGNRDVSGTASHCIWGYWQGTIDPANETIDFTQLRAAEFHLNALPFLEPPPLVNLTLESLQFNGDTIEADIGLRHPFLGLTEFTGFDVGGIFIGGGSVSGFTDPGIVMAGESDTRLLNYDGLSRWWNPAEFPVNKKTMFSYNDGLLGTPDAIGNYSATLNGYKYFCDDLDPNDPISDVTLERRGLFSAGKKNIRHYTIKLGDDGLVFNYAIDASWQFPNGDHPWAAPGDFPPGANRSEAWRISIGEIENTLWNDGSDNGGILRLAIDVYDWFGADLNTVRVESPGNFPMIESAMPTGGGDGYSTYEVEIIDATPAQGEIPIFISVISDEADFEGFIPGTASTAYFTYSAEVTGETPPAYHWEFDEITTFAGVWGGAPNSTEFDQYSPAICEETDGDLGIHWSGNDTNDVEPNLESAVWVRISTDNGVSYGQEWACAGGGSPGMYRTDTCKVMAGTQNDAYCTDHYGPGGADNGDIFYVEHGADARAAFTSKSEEDLEVIVDADGYIYGFDASGDNIQAKHSQAPETLYPIHWGIAPYFAFPVAQSGTISHVRSVDMDSSDVVWLAYYTNDETRIKLAHSTDSSPHESWEDSTIVYTAGSGISQVMNPSLWIDDNDVFHICYTRFGMVTGEYELVYTKDDSSFGNPTAQVIFGAPGGINDAHISVGEKYGKQVIIFTWEWDSSVYLYTLVDGTPIGTPQMIDGSDDDIDPDAILDADQCDLHALWSTMDGDNRDIARRNGVLVED